MSKTKNNYRINEDIRVSEVRIIGDNIESQVVKTKEALKLAEQLEVDLIEVSPNAKPPVCKLMDYGKFLYELKQKEKAQKKKSQQLKVKEIRFTPNTDEHDLAFKLKHAESFLEDGHKVKASVFFKGRSIMYKEQGELILCKFADSLAEVGVAENTPKLEGKRMIMFIKPKKSKN